MFCLRVIKVGADMFRNGFKHNVCINEAICTQRTPERTRVIVGSMNMGYDELYNYEAL